MSNGDIIAGGKAIEVLKGLKNLSKDTLKPENQAKEALTMAGFDVRPAGTNIFARYEGGAVAISIDGRWPTKRSIGKLRDMNGYRVIALKAYHNSWLRHEINAVIKLDVK